MDAHEAIEDAAWKATYLAEGIEAQVKASTLASAAERTAAARYVKATRATWHRVYVRNRSEDDRRAARVHETLAALEYGADDRP